MAANIQGHGAPTKKTPGVIGQHYTDLDTKQVWVCADVHHTMDPASLNMISQYEWDVQQTTDDNSSAFGKYKNPKPVLFEGELEVIAWTTPASSNATPVPAVILPSDFYFPISNYTYSVKLTMDDKVYEAFTAGVDTSKDTYNFFISDDIVSPEHYTLLIRKTATYEYKVIKLVEYAVGDKVYVKIEDTREHLYNTLDFNLLPENLGYPAEANYSWILGNRESGSSKMDKMESSLMLGSSSYENMSNIYTGCSGQTNLIAGSNNTPAPEAKSLTQSIIFGNTNKVSGSLIFALGVALKACNSYQTILGKYNELDPNYGTYYKDGKNLLMVGNGTSDSARSNAMTLDWSGNVWFQGTVEGTALILQSSTEGSTKRFKITVDDTGALTATEITE